ncbi:uncharacterized protein J4E87_009041 [Alternaria ethzedia]|uniref:uncharacterized protein n=1 Tax=Alternaria ethzedia TaxID=181014 RepID=UPI0020C564B3|nr:uncharacterized protein J4E87_009041 [Alternaria ethzedia]KAI4615582.1 hypothetical protein J4E87_009041 [Alternaria ethzedia]KAI4699969.1 hypothetical protein J4E81_004002 [Alternaria sp. BMP 2799]
MIRDFVQWTATLGETGELEQLRNCRVGIEAAEYLNQRILNHPRAKEPLVPALGGLPLALTQHIEDDLAQFRSFDIEPVFVFSGLDITKHDDPFRQKETEASVNINAWTLYDSHEAEASVAKFGQSTYVTPEDLFRALQSTLTERNIRWTVAPYSAWAQLAYLEKHEYVHAVYGSSDILIFECSKIITSWDFEARHFSFVRREKCVADLSKFVNAPNISDDIFLDTCILAGTPFLPTHPILDAPNRAELIKPHSAIKTIMNNGQSGYSVVVNNNDVPPAGKEYVTRYQKARLAVKNHPVYTEEGKVEPQNSGSMPNDAGQYLGQRLPDEILHYMSKGLISPHIIQWRTTCEVFEVPPMDGGLSPEYRDLVSSKLIPLRTPAVNLLSSTLHNWYRHQSLHQTHWYSPVEPNGKRTSTTIPVEKPSEAIAPSLVDTWNVKEATFRDVVGQYKDCGTLGAAILSLQNSDFVTKSVTKKDPKNPLSSTSEILYNSIWRFLALREYIDPKSHNLTQWGKVLVSIIAGLKGKPEHEEAAVIAVELIRLGLLNSDIDMFSMYNGAPMRGSTNDKEYNMLVSRVAGLGTLHHRPIGFTGPLSQHLLGYNSIINKVLIAMKLPFLLPNNCALSIAAKSYLDELLTGDADPTSPTTKSRVIQTASERYFPQSLNLAGDLKSAFSLWDAICAGVKSSNNSTVPDATKQVWAEADKWLAERR